VLFSVCGRGDDVGAGRAENVRGSVRPADYADRHMHAEILALFCGVCLGGAGIRGEIRLCANSVGRRRPRLCECGCLPPLSRNADTATSTYTRLAGSAFSHYYVSGFQPYGVWSWVSLGKAVRRWATDRNRIGFCGGAGRCAWLEWRRRAVLLVTGKSGGVTVLHPPLRNV
jgi:hypothetical protein